MYRRTVIKFTAVETRRWLQRPQKVGRLPDGSLTLWPCTQDDLNRLEDHLLDVVRANAGTFIPWEGQFVNDWTGSYLVNHEGVPPLKRQVRRTLPRMDVKNGNFSKRKRDGEIVVAPWRSGATVIVTAEPKPIVLSDADFGGHWHELFRMPTVFSPETSPFPGEFEGLCYSHAGVTYVGGELSCMYKAVSEEISETFGAYDIDAHADKCINILSDQLPRDEAMIVDCLADANRGQFDVMSNLAEIPATIISIMSGIKSILEAYKLACSDELRVYNQIKTLQKIEQPNAQIRKHIADLFLSISAIWLSFRLAIYPTVKTVEEALNLQLEGISLFYRFRKTKVGPLDFGYGGTRCLIDCTERAFIKRAYDTPIAALGWGNLSAVWQIVPLSFVIDRYISIGNVLSAWTSPNLSVKEGATYSWKISGVNGNTYDGVPYSVEVHMYERTVINPSSACGINFPPTRTFNQKLDHLALMWALVLDGLVRPKSTRKY